MLVPFFVVLAQEADFPFLISQFSFVIGGFKFEVTTAHADP